MPTLCSALLHSSEHLCSCTPTLNLNESSSMWEILLGGLRMGTWRAPSRRLESLIWSKCVFTRTAPMDSRRASVSSRSTRRRVLERVWTSYPRGNCTASHPSSRSPRSRLSISLKRSRRAGHRGSRVRRVEDRLRRACRL